MARKTPSSMFNVIFFRAWTCCAHLVVFENFIYLDDARDAHGCHSLECAANGKQRFNRPICQDNLNRVLTVAVLTLGRAVFACGMRSG